MTVIFSFVSFPRFMLKVPPNVFFLFKSLDNSWRTVLIMKCISTQFSPVLCYFTSPKTEIPFFSTMLQNPYLCSFLTVKQQPLYPCTSNTITLISTWCFWKIWESSLAMYRKCSFSSCTCHREPSPLECFLWYVGRKSVRCVLWQRAEAMAASGATCRNVRPVQGIVPWCADPASLVPDPVSSLPAPGPSVPGSLQNKLVGY